MNQTRFGNLKKRKKKIGGYIYFKKNGFWFCGTTKSSRFYIIINFVDHFGFLEGKKKRAMYTYLLHCSN